MEKRKIQIFDTTLRDGEQVPGSRLNVKEKVTIAKQLDLLGVDIIEAGFPISSPGDFEAVQSVSKVVKNASICALSRAVKEDIKAAADALKYAAKPRIHTGIGTSESHIKFKLQSTQEKVLERVAEAVAYAKSFVEDIEFYAEDAGRTEEAYLARVCEVAIKNGATVLNIPDTTGYCLPHEYGAKIKYLMENVKGIQNVTLSTHCHNDLGLATANSIAGVIHGAKQIECTINGIGERAGNTSLEEVVMIMRLHKDLNLHTGVNTKKIYETSQMVSELMCMPIQPNKAIVGSNAFSHSSGIHQDGVIKHRETYEIIDPAEVGVDKSSIVLTARSGRAALAFRLKQVGYNFDKEQVNIAYETFLKWADKQKEIYDDDLHHIVEECELVAI